MYYVYATTFGTSGGSYACGDTVRDTDRVVALPAKSALGDWVRLHYEGWSGVYYVGDLGPWRKYWGDDPYWRTKTPPRAWTRKWEAYPTKTETKICNGAGIDLTAGVWRDLGVPAVKSRNWSAWLAWEWASFAPWSERRTPFLRGREQ